MLPTILSGVRGFVCFVVGGWLLALDIHASVAWMSTHTNQMYGIPLAASVAIVCTTFTSVLIGGGAEILIQRAAYVAAIGDRTLRLWKIVQLIITGLSVLAMLCLCYYIDIVSSYHTTQSLLTTLFLVFMPEGCFSLSGYNFSLSQLSRFLNRAYTADLENAHKKQGSKPRQDTRVHVNGGQNNVRER